MAATEGGDNSASEFPSKSKKNGNVSSKNPLTKANGKPKKQVKVRPII